MNRTKWKFARLYKFLQSEKIRYFLCGVTFTVTGPCVYWSLYRIGPLAGYIVSEAIMHSLRYFAYKKYVFYSEMKYKVTATRYMAGVIPSITFNSILIPRLSEGTQKEIVVIAAVTSTAIISYIANKTVFSIAHRKKGRLANAAHK